MKLLLSKNEISDVGVLPHLPGQSRGGGFAVIVSRVDNSFCRQDNYFLLFRFLRVFYEIIKGDFLAAEKMLLLDRGSCQPPAVKFILILSNVEKCGEISREDVVFFHGRKIYPLHDQLIPYIKLRQFFEIPGESPGL